ncbi:MAG: transketolase [Bdellovibrionales bacterium]|nr:transketolase [Bdellovibrionales bacterium]
MNAPNQKEDQKEILAEVDDLAVNTIRFLSVDAVEKAKSGHPGMPMGAAEYAWILWSRYLKFSVDHPNWPNRDRFVLSAGHGSMLLYSLLHLSGYELSLDEIKHFRQLGSQTPGHPEYGHTQGVEATTGPLGQGFANAVGMAIGAKMMAARFNNDGSLIDHKVWAIVSDGDLMEGVTSEAASIAGHLGLDNLIFIYDDNKISIDGNTDNTFTENVAKRFEAYGWNTQKINGHNRDEIIAAYDSAMLSNGKPVLILAQTQIGFGAPNKQNTSKAHGEPLGAEEALGAKKALGWPQDQLFYVPPKVQAFFKNRNVFLTKEYHTWKNQFDAWKAKHPELAKLWDQYWNKDGSQDLYHSLSKDLPKMPGATRNISAMIQQRVSYSYPSLVAGSADLAGSTKAVMTDSSYVSKTDFRGRNIHFGVREHAMGAITNGMALYGSFIPVSSTFLVFSDYMRPAIRVAALSKIQSIYVFTHDSIFLGEDGPTHQPIEHIPSLRLIPNLHVVRPATSLECLAAWSIALNRKSGPTALILTRQNLPDIQPDASLTADAPKHGGYVFQDSKDEPQLILIATGSELQLAVEAKRMLDGDGILTRVVSMPCLETFLEQTPKYQESVLPLKPVPIVAIEAAQCDLWFKLGRSSMLTLGINRFGASAPMDALSKYFGFTSDQVYKNIKSWYKP